MVSKVGIGLKDTAVYRGNRLSAKAAQGAVHRGHRAPEFLLHHGRRKDQFRQRHAGELIIQRKHAMEEGGAAALQPHDKYRLAYLHPAETGEEEIVQPEAKPVVGVEEKEHRRHYHHGENALGRIADEGAAVEAP
jgi:hypothetical protein